MLALQPRTTILRKLSLALFVAMLALAGCDQGTPAAPAPKKTNQFESGRFALQKMIPAARLWAEDAAPIRLESSANSENSGQGGKAIFWRANFGSRTRLKQIPYSWSGAADAARKIDHATEDGYNPNNRSEQTWDLNYLKTDTDAAFATAQEHGGKELTDKDPKQPVIYLLDWDAQSSQLRWHVIYGASTSGAKLTVLVNASSGVYLRKE
jgi:hypothetical protein